MANSIKFMNEGFDRKYAGIKPSYDDCLYESIKSLTERQQEWSEEDKKDNKLLWDIWEKRRRRSNSGLSPEEDEVSKKYNLPNPEKRTNVNGEHWVRSLSGEADSYLAPNLYTDKSGKAPAYERQDEINLADRARKMQARYNNQKGVSKYDNDMQLNYYKMQNDLNDRNYYQKELADYESGNSYRDEQIAKLEQKLAELKHLRDASAKAVAANLENTEDRISKMLKRESLEESYTLPLDDDILAQVFENLVDKLGEDGLLYAVVNALAGIDYKVYAKVLTKIMVDEGFDMPETAQESLKK